MPFLVSIPFYGPDGEPVVDVIAFETTNVIAFETTNVIAFETTNVIAFETTMILVGAVVGAALFAYYVPRLSGDYFRGTLLAGVVWFGINVVLDLLVLVWLFAMPADRGSSRSAPATS